MSFRCDLLDAVVSEEVLKALRPAELQLALGALRELEVRDQAILRQWQMRLERAEYEVALAERRYQEVDPSNRLVANTLERRWNETLLHLQDLKKQAADFRRKEARVFTPEQKAKVLALARISRVCGMHQHTSQGPQTNVAVAHQRYYGQQISRAKTALRSHPLAGWRLHRPLRADSTKCSRSSSLSFSDCRSHPRPGVQFA